MGFVKNILRTNSVTGSLLELYFLNKKYLGPKGWFKAANAKQSIDKGGNPIPWLPYSAIYFIEERLKKDMSVFEFGSGNSTIWLADKVKRVVSVEHDDEYYNYVSLKLSKLPNVEYIKAALGDTYTLPIGRFENAFDIVIVDGRQRVECAKKSINALKPEGIVIWDNSDRSKYNEGYDYLINLGFKRLDFRGHGPGLHDESQTAIFYRSQNCFNI